MKTLNQVKIEHIQKVLEFCKFNRNHACEVLKISVRGLRNIINANPEAFKEHYARTKLDRDIDELVEEMEQTEQEMADSLGIPKEALLAGKYRSKTTERSKH